MARARELKSAENVHPSFLSRGCRCLAPGSTCISVHFLHLNVPCACGVVMFGSLAIIDSRNFAGADFTIFRRQSSVDLLADFPTVYSAVAAH